LTFDFNEASRLAGPLLPVASMDMRQMVLLECLWSLPSVIFPSLWNLCLCETYHSDESICQWVSHFVSF